jgi:uncharacterized RDD family membrane protein YckC
VTREARLAQASALQGTRAGFISRIVAAAVDIGIVFLLETAIVVFVALTSWVVTRRDELSLDSPPPLVTAILGFALSVFYLGYLWSTTGRTVGEQILGLRTLTEHGSRVPTSRAYARAILMVIFPIGLLWILISRRNASIQDLLCRTTVVYDWSYHAPAS